MKKRIVAYNIDWDIDIEEMYDILDNSTVTAAAKMLEISPERYANMTTEERHDYAYDKIHHNRLDAAEMLGLPDEVEIPEDILEYYEITSANDDMSDITDWLSDEYGYCINGYDVKDTIMKNKDGSLTLINDNNEKITLTKKEVDELSEFFYWEGLKEDVLAELKLAEENYSQEIIDIVKSNDKSIREITEDYECNRNSCDGLGIILANAVGEYLEKVEKDISTKKKIELYNIYKQEWLDENISPEIAEEARKEYEDEKDEYGEDFEYSSFEEYIEDVGYGGSLYVCYEEFLDCEYKDTDWLSGHLTAKDAMKLAEYDRDFPLGKNEVENYKWADSKPAKKKTTIERE